MRPAAIHRSHQSRNDHGIDFKFRAVDVCVTRISGKWESAVKRDVLLDMLPILKIPGRINRHTAVIAAKLLTEFVTPHLVGFETQRRRVQPDGLQICQTLCSKRPRSGNRLIAAAGTEALRDGTVQEQILVQLIREIELGSDTLIALTR